MTVFGKTRNFGLHVKTSLLCGVSDNSKPHIVVHHRCMKKTLNSEYIVNE